MRLAFLFNIVNVSGALNQQAPGFASIQTRCWPIGPYVWASAANPTSDIFGGSCMIGASAVDPAFGVFKAASSGLTDQIVSGPPGVVEK